MKIYCADSKRDIEKKDCFHSKSSSPTHKIKQDYKGEKKLNPLKYEFDINSPKIKGHIKKFHLAYDSEVSKRLTHAWEEYLKDTQEWVINRFGTLLRKEFERKLRFHLDYDGNSRVVRFEFDEYRGDSSQSVLLKINKFLAVLQSNCFKWSLKFLPDEARKRCKKARKKTPHGFEKGTMTYLDYTVPPRKQSFITEKIMDKAINSLIENLVEEKYSFAEIEQIFNYHDVMKYLPPAKNRVRQLANRYQRQAPQ